MVGNPGKVVRIQGRKVNPSTELDQVKIPDPVKLEICRLKETITLLQEQLQNIEGKLGMDIPSVPHVLDESSEIYVSEQFNERIKLTEFIRQPGQHKCNQIECETREICDQYASKEEK